MEEDLAHGGSIPGPVVLGSKQAEQASKQYHSMTSASVPCKFSKPTFNDGF